MCKRWKSIRLCVVMSLIISFQVWGLPNNMREGEEESHDSFEQKIHEISSKDFLLSDEPMLEIGITDSSDMGNTALVENLDKSDELPEESNSTKVEEEVPLPDIDAGVEKIDEEEWMESSLQDEEAMQEAFQTAPAIERFSLVSNSSALIPNIENKPIKIAMSPTDTHMLILKEDGTVWAVGENTRGQLGDGTNISKTIPVQAIGLTKVIDIAVGADHSIALKSDGTVWAWGANYYGQVGDNTKTDKNTPQRVKGPGDVYKLSGITAISAGRHHNLALKNDGTVYAWGDNKYGQLGDITENPYSKRPIQMKLDNGYAPDSGEVYGDAGDIQNVQRICAGGLTSYVIALTNDEDTGTLFGCGRGRNNRLGEEFENYDLYFLHEIGARTPDVPYFVADYYYLMVPYGNTEYVSVALGGGKAFYIGKDGTVWEDKDYGKFWERRKR